ncbi:NAD(P)/FAD-dependent oxidoreductase [Rhodocytophaga rosea]|uniref:NAD(P)/FAD-dependent oxidoreductase n=1 Tax=Rhodocytophaga rosea TaxID=2704465 RepID=A0A6C0GCV3_9BACT|nr:NAD(P)/FAD-dependent oxidoreductase [Rhodocytophaga rosea]QHT65643.1 NAD(P)/FAD-dependent oxidoreductase [Rhodocytophaga rosea]
MPVSKSRIVVIGGGAAGFFGAITCAQTFPETEVVLLEKSNKVLAKVRISGGGRCNVTHACYENSRLVKHYPRGSKALLSPFAQFSTSDTIRWFEDRGVKLKTEADGRIFPVTDSSETIVDCLYGEARRHGVHIQTSCGVREIIPLHQAEAEETGFELHLLNGSVLTCNKVLIATGGNPNADSYEWLRIGEKLTLLSPVPSLFTFNTPDSAFLELSGVSVQHCLVKIAGIKLQQTGPVLFTHWGFSGPAILKLSAWGARELHALNYQFQVFINWLPDYNEETLRTYLLDYREKNLKKQVAANPVEGLPQRLWKKLTEQAGIPEDGRWADLPKKNLNRLIDLLTRSSFKVNGKSTFKEEFVTCGGIGLENINLQTMESKFVKGIYYAGEVLDIDGITGGFNFQSAWTTGYIAGKHMGL